MALGRGEPNRRAPEIGFALGRRPALHQQFHNVQVTGPRRAVQRRPPVLIGRVYFSALAEQHLHHLVVAVRRRYVKPGFAVTVRAVQQLGRSAQQKTDHGDVAPETGQVQRIETVLRGSRLHLNHTRTRVSFSSSSCSDLLFFLTLPAHRPSSTATAPRSRCRNKRPSEEASFQIRCPILRRGSHRSEGRT